MVRPKTHASRALRDLEMEGQPSWQLLSLAEVGEPRFARSRLAASEGDPFDVSTPESAMEDLRELIEAAAGAFDAAEWFIVSDDHGEIGVVLPQPFPDDPGVGTLFYVAVLPERRGQGFGTALHHFGLQCLVRRGAVTYQGTTDLQNTAMQTIFMRNSCQAHG